MRALRVALVPAALALAVAAEWIDYQPGDDLALIVADGVVGVVLVGCGVVAWERRGESRVGPLMALAGFTWLAGTLWAAALYLHRGPLVHLHISYPTGRLRRRLALATVIGAYVDAAVAPLARNDVVTLLLAALVALAAADVFLRTSGTARRAGIPALAAALAFAAVLALGAVQRLAGWGSDDEVLWAYDLVIGCLAVVLLLDLLRGRWEEAVVTDLVVDLGRRADTRTLRDELGRALGDRSLVLGYWIPEEERYVDDEGRPVELPEPGAGRAVTPIAEDSQPVAVLIHDAAVLEEPALVEAVASAARIAVSNARLQADVQARVRELAASRRRIVEAAAAQRGRLEHDLRAGVGHRPRERRGAARAGAPGCGAARPSVVRTGRRGATRDPSRVARLRTGRPPARADGRRAGGGAAGAVRPDESACRADGLGRPTAPCSRGSCVLRLLRSPRQRREARAGEPSRRHGRGVGRGSAGDDLGRRHRRRPT